MGKLGTSRPLSCRKAASLVAEETYSTVPHTFVFQRGQIGRNVGQLVLDIRRVMEPFTARSLKVRKKNVLKDFVAVAGPLGITHFSIFTKTENSINMRLARLPKGPTLYFHVAKYTLIKDVISSLKRHRMHEQQFSHHPLLVLNNFGIEGMHIKLMATMFQNMFPSINVHKLNLNSIKRCVLLNYDPVSQEVEFRHYSLKVVPVGMSRGVKKLMQEKFPNMSKLEDISELLMKGVNLSESEAEQDGDHNITELPQVYSGRGNMASQQSAVRLTEIGPRMTLQLVKIVEGMGEGKVLYHSFVSKTEEELQEMLNRKEARLKEKEERKRKQEQNIALKKEKRDQNNFTVAICTGSNLFFNSIDMFPGAKRKRGPGKSPKPFKKRKLSQGKGPPHDKKSFKLPDRGNKYGGKRFGDRKPPEGRNRFRKSEGGKKFGQKGGKGCRFAGQKKGDAGKKFGGPKSFKGRAVLRNNRKVLEEKRT
uniref:Suppressor of SWI4 1 homolog n=1 Tax=Sinocyclocheilus anshuiensis TaxID=1608454 RepID=A0A671STB4_9TELE